MERDRKVHVLAGPRVRRDVSSFLLIEGGMSQEFRGSRLDARSGYLFGTGLATGAGGLRAFSGSTSCDPVFVLDLKRKGLRYVSNSLLLLSAVSRDRSLIHAHKRMNGKAGAGLSQYARVLAEGEAYTVYRYLGGEIFLPFDHRHKPPVEYPYLQKWQFDGYAGYVNHLVGVLAEVHADYKAVGASIWLSKGYDSVASAVIGASARLTDNWNALCKLTDRHEREDDGRSVAEHLGMQV